MKTATELEQLEDELQSEIAKAIQHEASQRVLKLRNAMWQTQGFRQGLEFAIEAARRITKGAAGVVSENPSAALEKYND